MVAGVVMAEAIVLMVAEMYFVTFYAPSLNSWDSLQVAIHFVLVTGFIALACMILLIINLSAQTLQEEVRKQCSLRITS
jgi:hypothetical protein